MHRWAALSLFLGTAFGQNADGIAFFETRIRPLLAENCYGCHSSKLAKPMGGLTLDSKSGMLRGGASGAPAVIAGKPDESLIVAAIRQSGNLKMPPGKKLDAAQIDA